MKPSWDRDYPRFLKLFFGVIVAVIAWNVVSDWHQNGFVWPTIDFDDFNVEAVTFIKVSLLVLAVWLASRCIPEQRREQFKSWQRRRWANQYMAGVASIAISFLAVKLLLKSKGWGGYVEDFVIAAVLVLPLEIAWSKEKEASPRSSEAENDSHPIS